MEHPWLDADAPRRMVDEGEPNDIALPAEMTTLLADQGKRV